MFNKSEKLTSNTCLSGDIKILVNDNVPLDSIDLYNALDPSIKDFYRCILRSDVKNDFIISPHVINYILNYENYDKSTIPTESPITSNCINFKYARDISIGDTVISYNTNKNKLECKQVTNFITNNSKDLYTYSYEDGSSLTVTDNHKVVLEDGSSLEIDKSDYILTLSELGITKSKKVNKESYKAEDVYDLEIEDNHNFLIISSDSDVCFNILSDMSK